ncbi:hypothetical protein D6817_04110, partial [Candidatus Pacearchaeota archaeon]
MLFVVEQCLRVHVSGQAYERAQALEPGERAVLVAYWDTEGVKPGSYDAELIVRYTLPRSEKLASEGINKSVGE